MALDGVSPKSKWKYHVFLSFRGEDTRLSFTDHLYEALVSKCIITFRDDEELERGEVISQNLLGAIEESLHAILIISQNYASSTWCLDELQKIVDCKQRLGLEILPIFYGVDPSDVRHQRGSCAEAFKDHEQKFIGDKEKVQKWRDALKYVANLAGWDSKHKRESKLIEEIVEQVWTKVIKILPTNTDELVAIEAKVDDMYSHLKLGLHDVRFIGIWGMGGIGKTTLADIVFNRIKSKFDFSYFLADIREASNEGGQGLVKLQGKLLSHLKPTSMTIDTLSQGRDMIKNLLHNKKVLLVLDDVSSEIQLENLAGNQNWFGPGSRIIVTTRDKHLISHGLLHDMYEIKILNDEESLSLFCEKAFRGNPPMDDYLELSKRVVKYAKGLPLALKVLGSLLRERSVQEWEATLIKIHRVPTDDIYKKLKISYDMLEDEYKTIFLIIACLFKGWPQQRVIHILDNCDLHPTIGINVLIEKSLVICDNDFVLRMHDLIEEMGKNIVIRESPIHHGRREWLWSLEDIDKVLSKNMGTEKVQGIVLDHTLFYDAHWKPDAFSKMCNIRLLIIQCYMHLQHDLKCLSSSLKVLIWEGFPMEALPLGAQLDELVHLEIYSKNIKKLWNGTQLFGKLRYIKLTNSECLIETPDISGVPNLEQLILAGCTNLVKVHKSVGQHNKLEILHMLECINLETFPNKMKMCSLKILALSHCSKIKKLPDFDEKMERVSQIYLENCENLFCLPNTITNLKSLRVLNVFGCSKVYKLPDNLNENKALEILDLSQTSIREMNSSLYRLENLKSLSFGRCSGFGPTFKSHGLLTSCWKGWQEKDHIIINGSFTLPCFILCLPLLSTLDLSFCKLELLPENLGNLPSLEELYLGGNVNLTLQLASIANLPKLRFLVFNGVICGSRALLLPHVRIYPKDFATEISVTDESKLWKLFESCCSEDDHVEDCSPCSFSKIPRAMNNNYDSTFVLNGPVLLKRGSSAYIPNDYCLGAWWGVAVFVVLDPLVSSSIPLENPMYLHFWWQPLNQDGKHRSVHFFIEITGNSNYYLITMTMNDNVLYIQRHQSGYHDNDESKHFVGYQRQNVIENSRLFISLDVKGRNIRKWWWHQLGQDDFKFQMLAESSMSMT